jgi:hypothetical protein
MDDARFWDLMTNLNWKARGDGEKVAEPLIEALAALPDAEIAGFQNLLTAKLYALDGRAWARESGDTIWFAEPDDLSEDGFLYARCAVVGRGREFYERVLGDPKQMPGNAGFESLLYVASTAYERKTGLDAAGELDASDLSFETFSNTEGWP